MRSGRAGQLGMATPTSAELGRRGEAGPDGPAAAASRPGSGWLGPKRLGSLLVATLFAGQAAVLLLGSVAQYRRFDLSLDVATYGQAWWLIGHGHLDPFSTTLGIRFLANDFELVLWPLALLGRAWSSVVLLAVVEDLALVATNLLTLRWAKEILAASGLAGRPRRLVLAFAAASLLLDPWCYETALWPFHLEPFVALAAVGAGRSLWAGRTRSAWGWSACLLFCGLVGALALIGIGITGTLMAGFRRRTGVGLVLLGVGFTAVLGHFGLVGQGGRIASEAFGYLGPSRGGILSLAGLAGRALDHPDAIAARFLVTAPVLLGFLLPSGLLGVASRWAAGMELAVLLPAALTDAPFFHLGIRLGFQVWPALPFALIGTVSVLSSRRWWRSRGVSVGAELTGAGVVCLAIASIAFLPGMWAFWIPELSPAGARSLGQATHLPPSVEVVAWGPISGRFAERPELVVIHTAPDELPVLSRSVAVVLSAGGVGTGRAFEAEEAFAGALEAHGAVPRIGGGRDALVLSWRPPPGVGCLVFPSARLLRSCTASAPGPQ